MHISIRWKLIVSIILPLLAISSIVMWLTLELVYTNGKLRLHEVATSFAKSQAEQLDGKFSSIAQIANSTAAFLEVEPDIKVSQLYALLRANLSQNPLVYGSAIAFEPGEYDKEQKLFAPYVYRDRDTIREIDIASDAYDYSNGGWEWYSRPRLFAKPVWTEPFYDKGAGNILMVTYSVPFYVQQRFRGVVTIDVELDAIRKQIALESIENRSYVIVSAAGNFISHPDSDFIMRESLQSRAQKINSPEYLDFISQILAHKAGIQELHGVTLGGMKTNSTTWIFYAPIRSTGWAFSTAVPEEEMTRDIRSQIGKGVLGLCVLLLLVIISVSLVSTSLTRPISKLAVAVSKLGSGQLDSKVEGISSSDEIGQLAQGFNRMLEELKANMHSLGREMAARELVEKELTVARDIQASLLPHTFPPFPDRAEFDLHGINEAARGVAGDFFDFFFVNNEKLVMVMADVSGKGVPAAMVMAVARTIIRNLANVGLSPAEILLETNQLLLENESPSIFITMIIAIYEPESGRMIYSNAGHHPPYRMDGKGHVTKFAEAEGTIVGMIDGIKFSDSETVIEPGEYVVMYTDGVPEARSPDGNFYGEKYFEALLSANAGISAAEICELTISEVNGFQAGNLSDDMTLMVFKRLS